MLFPVVTKWVQSGLNGGITRGFSFHFRVDFAQLANIDFDIEAEAASRAEYKLSGFQTGTEGYLYRLRFPRASASRVL